MAYLQQLLFEAGTISASSSSSENLSQWIKPFFSSFTEAGTSDQDNATYVKSGNKSKSGKINHDFDIKPSSWNFSGAASNDSMTNSKTSFYMDCDPSYQIHDIKTALRSTIGVPFESECEFTRRQFDIFRHEVEELPEKCIDKKFIFEGASNNWYKCCAEIRGVGALFKERPGLACKKIFSIPGIKIANAGVNAHMQCFTVEKENRTTLGYVEDPSCFCPEGKNGGCWCPNPKKECIKLGRPNRVKHSMLAPYKVFYIP